MYLLELMGWIGLPECPGRSQLASRTCQSDLPNFVGTFDLGLGQPYPRPDNIMGFLDSLDIGFERPSPGPMT